MDKLVSQNIKLRFESVKDRVTKAARSVNRDPSEIRIIVVTKAHSIEVTKVVGDSGIKYIGENYIEEAIPKINALIGKDISWHMIGHIQSRKALQVCEHFSWVHSLDRIKLARRMDRFLGELGKRMPVLLECNVSGEQSKFGYPAWNEENWPYLRKEVEEIISLPNLNIRGLMTVPPWNPDPEVARPFFKQLSRLRDYLANHFPNTNWDELSIGMSGDFEIAIQEGATFVRIGTAILGPRT